MSIMSGDESAKYAEDVPGGKTFCFLSELAVKYGVWASLRQHL